MTFDNFYEGNSYALAAAVAKNVAEQPGGDQSPLIICGPCGVGKTHLLYAIAKGARSLSKNRKIIYVSSADFAEELINSIIKGEKAAFFEKYREADMLLIDNFELLAAKEQTQEEFFRIMDCYSKNNKQIVLCISGNPSEHHFADKIKSRLGGGIILDMPLPDSETKSAIVDGIAKEWHLAPDEQTKRHIICKLNTASEIKGVLKNIKTVLEITHQYPSLEDLKLCLPQL